MFNDAAGALLESGALAQLITINVDGSPQVRGVWIGLNGDELVVASLPKLLQQLAHVYLGPDAIFPGPDAPPGYIFHITPEKVLGEGTWS